MNLSSCLFAAATTFGWVEPVLSTAIPAEKSMNRFPSTSVTTEPWADSTTSGTSLAIDGDMAFEVLLMTALAFGPGKSPLTILACFLEDKYQSPRNGSLPWGTFYAGFCLGNDSSISKTGRLSCLPSRETTFSPSICILDISTWLTNLFLRTWTTSTAMLMASPLDLRITCSAPLLNMVMQAVT